MSVARRSETRTATMTPSNTRPGVERRPRSLARTLRRGQAMVEYSVVSHFLLFSGTVLLLPLIAKLYAALDAFYRGMYMVISQGS